jgi:hypothetical protein
VQFQDAVLFVKMGTTAESMDDATRTFLSPPAAWNVGIGIAWVLVLVLDWCPCCVRRTRTFLADLPRRPDPGRGATGTRFSRGQSAALPLARDSPLLVERATGISAWHVNVMFVAATTVLSLLVTARLLNTLGFDRRHRAGCCWPPVSRRWCCREAILASRDLAFLLALPFVALAAVRISQRTSSSFAIAIGVMGGAGLRSSPFPGCVAPARAAAARTAPAIHLSRPS